MHTTRHVRAAVAGAALSAVVALGMAGAAYAAEPEDQAAPPPSCAPFAAIADPAQRDEAITQASNALDPAFREMLDTNEDGEPCGPVDEGATWHNSSSATGGATTTTTSSGNPTTTGGDGDGSDDDGADKNKDDDKKAKSAAKDRNCADFKTQAEAQAAFDADKSDPDNLDADDDKIACEDHFKTEGDQVAVKPKGGVATGGDGR